MKRVRRERADGLGMQRVGPRARPHIRDDRIECGFGVPCGGRDGTVVDGDKQIGPVAQNLDGDIADQRAFAFFEPALERHQRAAAVEADQRTDVLRGARARHTLGIERGGFRLVVAAPAVDKSFCRGFDKLARRPHHRQLARPLARRWNGNDIVGALQRKAFAETAAHRGVKHRRHDVEADGAELLCLIAFAVLEPRIECVDPFRAHAGAHVGNPGQRPHRRQIARAHGAQQPRVAGARQQRHAPTHARNEAREKSERCVFAHIAVNQNGRPAVAVHGGAQFVEPQRELVIWQAILRPDIGTDRHARLHGLHGARLTLR